jgi:hypothetical protein
MGQSDLKEEKACAKRKKKIPLEERHLTATQCVYQPVSTPSGY